MIPSNSTHKVVIMIMVKLSPSSSFSAHHNGYYLSIPIVLVCLSWVVVKVANTIWLTPKKLKKFLEDQGVKGPEYKVLQGNMVEALKVQEEAWSKPMPSPFSHDIAPRVIPYLADAAHKYGKLSIAWIGYFPQVMLNDPEMAKEVLTNKCGLFERPPMLPSMKPLNPGLLNLEGEVWAARRRTVSPAFHLEKLKEMLPSFSTSCNELVQKWEEKLLVQEGHLDDDQSCEVDVWNDLQSLTGDVISRTAFGSSYEEGKKIFEMQTEQFQIIIKGIFKLYLPGYRFLPTRANLRLRKLRKGIKSMLGSIIDKREKELKSGTITKSSTTDDLLGLMLQSNKDLHDNYHGKLKGGGGGHHMTRDEIIEECELFYFAGQETTSVLLTWTMILMSMHQEWQEQARAEVFQVCGKTTPTFDNLNHLKIVTSILYEVLRLYPPGVVVARHTSKEAKVGDITIPAKVRVLLPSLLIHHDRGLWGDDANEFKPDRFSGGIANASVHQLAFFPFGYGPRVCLGQNFALLEAKMAIATILQRFTFELSPSYTHAPYIVLTLQPQHGAQLILRAIKN